MLTMDLLIIIGLALGASSGLCWIATICVVVASAELDGLAGRSPRGRRQPSAPEVHRKAPAKPGSASPRPIRGQLGYGQRQLKTSSQRAKSNPSRNWWRPSKFGIRQHVRPNMRHSREATGLRVKSTVIYMQRIGLYATMAAILLGGLGAGVLLLDLLMHYLPIR